MKVFDFDKVILTTTESDGTQTIGTGFANNSTIDAEYKNDAYTPHIGAKGMDDAAFAKNNDKSGTVKFKIMNTSDFNKTLTRLYNSGETFALDILDGNDLGKSEVKGAECVIQKPAPWTRGADIQGQEWTVGVLNLVMDYN